MKDQIDSLPDLINEDQKLYGINFDDSPNLLNEIIGKTNSRMEPFISRTTISNTEILFNPTTNITKKNIDFPELKKKSFLKKLLISHDSKCKSIFDIIVLILINISSLRILYDFCFVETDKNNNNLFINKPSYYFIEFLFIIFIILQFFQTYQDPSTLLIINDYKYIALKYIKGWFFIDLLSIIPFELFISSSNTNLKYLKIIRFLRLPKFVQTIDIKRFDNLATSFLTKGENENA